MRESRGDACWTWSWSNFAGAPGAAIVAAAAKCMGDGNMSTINVFMVNFRIKLVIIFVKPNKPPIAVRNIKPTTQSLLENTKNTVSSGCFDKTNY